VVPGHHRHHPWIRPFSSNLRAACMEISFSLIQKLNGQHLCQYIASNLTPRFFSNGSKMSFWQRENLLSMAIMSSKQVSFFLKTVIGAVTIRY
jgi:hypothetical protein